MNMPAFQMPETSDPISTPNAPSNFESVTPDKNVNVTERTKNAFNFFVNKGLQPHVAAGIVGNLAVESMNFSPDVISGKRKGDNGTAFGVAQWRGERQTEFYNWARKNNKDPYSVDSQLEFVYHEASKRGDIAAAQKATNAKDASMIFANRFERPNPKLAHYGQRAGIANQLSGYNAGGEYCVSPAELQQILALGGEVEFL
jgi:hypothetical protein